MVEQSEEATRNIEQWKVKRLIDNLDRARGNGTSLISLIIPARDQLNFATKLVAEEHGKASNIKSRVVRQAVQSALLSVRERLKLHSKVPPNGLIIYCGEVISETGVTEKKYTIDFEPFKPLNTSLYLCDNKFHTEPLKELLENDDRFGFIIMDGNGALFGAVQGRAKEVLYKFSVDLPKKHGRGGQSALRFARLRMERRHNYLRRVSEAAVQNFIVNDRLNVTGIVMAGSAEFKKELSQSDMLDPRIVTKIVKIVDVAYGGENGFNQAIELAADTLTNVKLVRERQLVCKFFEEVAQDSRKFVYGVEDTLKALAMGAVETLILHDNIEGTRYVLRNNVTETTKEVVLKPEQETQEDSFKENEVALEVLEKLPFSEWIVDHYTKFGSVLEFVSDRTQEGSQFVKGFGGIGGLLRYQLDMMEINALDEDLEEDWDDEFM